VVYVCCHDERWWVGGGAPASDVDHGVLARLNRFKVNQNLVINMIWVMDAADWLGRSVTARVMVWSVSWRRYGWAATRIGEAGTEKAQIRGLIILG
jgi:hypothetical protein